MGAPDRHDHPPLDCAREGGLRLTEALHTADERQGEGIRVLLVDDHDLFRTGLRNLLREYGGVSVVGEAANASCSPNSPPERVEESVWATRTK